MRRPCGKTAEEVAAWAKLHPDNLQSLHDAKQHTEWEAAAKAWVKESSGLKANYPDDVWQAIVGKITEANKEYEITRRLINHAFRLIGEY